MVDAKESRQITALPEILKEHKDLVSYRQIVIGLGTNGVLTDDAIEQTMSLLKDKKSVLGKYKSSDWLARYDKCHIS